jgi:hypothetical protein
MCSFSAIILHKGHNQKEVLKAYWSTEEEFSVPFYGKIMK